MRFFLRFIAAVSLATAVAACAFAQADNDLTAKKRLFPGIGPGLRSVKRDANGRTYVLVSPAPGLTVFDADGKVVFQISNAPAAAGEGAKAKSEIVFGEDCDVDAEGRVYVADRGANAVKIFSPTGELLRAIPVPAPLSVAAMAGGEVAVSTLRELHLVIVFDVSGKVVREFGDPQELTARADLNRFLNIGRLARDAQDHLYYGFDYLPEPTVRQYDRHGYSGLEIQLTSLDVLPAAQAVRREIDRLEKRGDRPAFKRLLTAMGVDPATGEVWMALENSLIRFDREGNRRAEYKLYTPEGARLEATSLLIEPDRLFVGSDPLGIYEFIRPDKRGARDSTQ